LPAKALRPQQSKGFSHFGYLRYVDEVEVQTDDLEDTAHCTQIT
jgi:hypothetical protein